MRFALRASQKLYDRLANAEEDGVDEYSLRKVAIAMVKFKAEFDVSTLLLIQLVPYRLTLQK